MSGSAGSSLFFLVIIAVPVLLIVFQRRTMRRQTEATQGKLEPGAEVMTGGGLYAFVHDIDGEVVELETSPGVITRWDRRAIVRVISEPETDDLDGDAASDDDLEADEYVTEIPRDDAQPDDGDGDKGRGRV